VVGIVQQIVRERHRLPPHVLLQSSLFRLTPEVAIGVQTESFEIKNLGQAGLDILRNLPQSVRGGVVRHDNAKIDRPLGAPVGGDFVKDMCDIRGKGTPRERQPARFRFLSAVRRA
jgi:hypothetical protein